MTEGKQSYYQLLRHPKWQRKRLEVLARNEWKCQRCADTESNLQVHHARYVYGRMPWDYEDRNFYCLCEKCHKLATDCGKELKDLIGKLDPVAIERLLGFAKGLRAEEFIEEPIAVPSPDVCFGLADCFHLDSDDVWDALIDGKIDGSKLTSMPMMSSKRGKN